MTWPQTKRRCEEVVVDDGLLACVLMAVVLRYSRLDEIARRLKPNSGRAVKAGAELVAEAAKARVPVDTGRLKRAIHVERNTTPRPGEASYAVVAGDEDAFYGHMVEHGTARGGEAGGQGERGPTPPHPFLVPALEASREEIIQMVRSSLKEATE